jgi:plastocyanin
MNRIRASILISALLTIIAASGCSPGAKQAAPAVPAQPAIPAFQVDPATAGSISGTIRYSGKRPPRKVIDMSSEPACVAAHKGKAIDESLLVSPSGQLANSFIYVKSGLEGKRFEISAAAVTIDQHGCWFHPRVLGVQVGQTFDVVNDDPVTHNIHPMAQANREWNHSQGAGDPPIHRKFLKPEIMIPVKCNIHSWMHAWIGVVDNPYFAISQENGSYTISNLPPGTYTIGFWHEGLAPQEQQITIAPHSNTAADITFKGQ